MLLSGALLAAAATVAVTVASGARAIMDTDTPKNVLDVINFGFELSGECATRGSAADIDVDDATRALEAASAQGMSSALIEVFNVETDEVCNERTQLRQALELCFDFTIPRFGEDDVRKRDADADAQREEAAALARMVMSQLLGANGIDLRVHPEQMQERRREARTRTFCAPLAVAATPFLNALADGQQSCEALGPDEDELEASRRKRQLRRQLRRLLNSFHGGEGDVPLLLQVPSLRSIVRTFTQLDESVGEDGTARQLITAIIAFATDLFSTAGEPPKDTPKTSSVRELLATLVCDALNIGALCERFGGGENSDGAFRRRDVPEQLDARVVGDGFIGVRASVQFCTGLYTDNTFESVLGETCCPFDFVASSGGTCGEEECCGARRPPPGCRGAPCALVACPVTRRPTSQWCAQECCGGDNRPRRCSQCDDVEFRCGPRQPQ